MSKVYPMQDYANALHKIAELEAHNRQLLNDKDASPAVIAGYREFNARLIAERDKSFETGVAMAIGWMFAEYECLHSEPIGGEIVDKCLTAFRAGEQE